MRRGTRGKMTRILALVDSGKTISQACKKVGMTPSHFYRLRKTTEGKKVRSWRPAFVAVREEPIVEAQSEITAWLTKDGATLTFKGKPQEVRDLITGIF